MTRIAGLVLIVGTCHVQCGCIAPLDFLAFKSFDEDEALEEMVDISDEKGPLERAIGFTHRNRSFSELSEEEREEFEDAEKLYDKQEYAAAEKAFKKIVHRHTRTSFSSLQENLWGKKKKDQYLWSKNDKYENTQIVEDALNMQAESQFQQQKYTACQDTYNTLVKEFPSTRYLNEYTKHMFSIARIWMGFPEDMATGDITLAEFEGDGAQKTLRLKETPKQSWDPSRRIPILPNFWDRSRPLFDTDGRALDALRAIWMNDPNGPLADDALMMTASYYLRKQNYSEADHMFEILRKEYPKSPHLENAYVLGSHVKLMSYQGPAYDSTTLEQARKLKEDSLRRYPGHPARERMQDELRKMEEFKAEEDWELVIYYYRKREPEAMKIYCKEILRRHPQTRFATLARSVLAELEDGNMINPRSITVKGPSSSVNVDSEEQPVRRGLRISPFVRLLPLPFMNREDSDESDAHEDRDDDDFADDNLEPFDETPGRVKLGGG